MTGRAVLGEMFAHWQTLELDPAQCPVRDVSGSSRQQVGDPDHHRLIEPPAPLRRAEQKCSGHFQTNADPDLARPRARRLDHASRFPDQAAERGVSPGAIGRIPARSAGHAGRLGRAQPPRNQDCTRSLRRRGERQRFRRSGTPPACFRRSARCRAPRFETLRQIAAIRPVLVLRRQQTGAGAIDERDLAACMAGARRACRRSSLRRQPGSCSDSHAKTTSRR